MVARYFHPPLIVTSFPALSLIRWSHVAKRGRKACHFHPFFVAYSPKFLSTARLG